MDILLVKILKIRILWDNQKFINMKTTLSTLLILLFLGVSFTGCEQIKDLADQKIDVEFEEDIVVTIPAEGKLKSLVNPLLIPFNGSVSINIMDNPDIYNHSEEIEDWEVTGVRLTVKDPGAAEVVVSDVTVTVHSDYYEGDAIFVVDGTWALISGEYRDFPNSNNNFSILENILDSYLPFTVYIDGESNKGGFNITWTYLQEVEVTVNPL